MTRGSSRFWLIVVLLLALVVGSRFGPIQALRARNQALIAFIKNRLSTPSVPAEVTAIELLQSSTRVGSGPANAYRWLGEMYLGRREYPQAQAALERAQSEGASDTMLWLSLAQAHTGQGNLVNAIKVLLDGLVDVPFNEAIYLQVQRLYEQQTMYLTDKTGWTDVPHREIGGGQAFETHLSLPATRPRWLRIFYFDYPEQNLAVFVNGQRIGEIRGRGGDWRTQSLLVSASAGDEAYVGLVNTSSSLGFGLRGLRLEYVSNVERFSDVTNPTWPNQPYLDLEPQGRHSTFLYLPTKGPRTLWVRFYDSPERHLSVLVDGIQVARLRGRQGRPGQGGWTTFSFSVPDTANELIEVTLTNPSFAEGTAVSHVAIVGRQ